MSQQKSTPAWLSQLAASKIIGGPIGRVLRVKLSVERADALVHELRPWLPLLLPYALWRGRKTYKQTYREALIDAARPKHK